MKDLMTRIAGEWETRNSIFDIPGELVRRVLELERTSPGFKINGMDVSFPVGPAAGPHTQIAPNIVASWLAGSRVFELKTVQENDRLEIAKPCIDGMDEGHNTEWSTELLLEEACAEYLRGWIAIHVLRAALDGDKRPVMFNMSVGYTLDGIKGRKVDAFIEGLRFPAATGIWKTALAEAAEVAASDQFARAFGQAGAERARTVVHAMPDRPVHSVTLSTMHGCPPAEISRIGAYLIEEKGFDTYIKLNPTLLGYDAVRGILDACGWQRIKISRPGFEHDLQFDAALDLISTLREKAIKKGVRFGVKLSNTLANENDGTRLGGNERYMSGRALFPITARLAAKIAAALDTPIPFSFCGGISAHNTASCLASGLGPLTLATDILKPGGYLRLEPIAQAAVATLSAGIPAQPDAAALARLADQALRDEKYRGDYKKGETSVPRKLPLTDCFTAPCFEACPAGQKPSRYIKALSRGDGEAALEIILADNPLPHITGLLCDHQCMSACARVDYEGPVEIRSLKLACARSSSIPVKAKPAVAGKGKTAVFGSGPAGLSCAHYLSKEGYPVTVFEKEACAGGIPAGVIPKFRIPREDIAADIDRIESMGARFSFGWSGKIDFAKLRSGGFTSFVLATGAPVPRELPLSGGGIPVVDALAFLEAAQSGSGAYDFARAVVVAGGGNTAMDASRVAARLPLKPAVSILYRRTLAEMPADREEFEAALADGVEFHDLSLPETMLPQNGANTSSLQVRTMTLGTPGPDGRRLPVPSDSTFTVPCDLIVAAVGETPDYAMLAATGLASGKDGRTLVDPETMSGSLDSVYVTGDARRGPSTIIASIADGRKAARSILTRAGIAFASDAPVADKADREALSRRGEPKENAGKAAAPLTPEWIALEAARCMSCDSACLRCVEVCPNRANFSLPVSVENGSPFSQPIQILHVDDLCNECGNCGFFCPYDGEPFAGKPTLFSGEESLRASRNAGFVFLPGSTEPSLLLRETPGTGSPVLTLGWQEWNGVQKQSSSVLAAMAREVYENHRYLLGGGTK